MKKGNHITFAAIFVLVFVLLLGYFNMGSVSLTLSSILIISILTLFYSLLPDIDHKNSTITWWFFGIGILGLLASMIEFKFNLMNISPFLMMALSTLLLVFTFLATNLFDHRGLIHSIPMGILSVVPLYFMLHSFAYCMIAYVAWHSHLIGDGYLLKFK